MENIRMQHGFTLIELLVVVLIIGVLAAVAVPQYQKAVDKTSIQCVLPILKSVTDAQRVAALQRGGYPTGETYFTFDEMDVALKVRDKSCTSTDICQIVCAGKEFNIILRNTETWANFYFWAGSLERLRLNTKGVFYLECASSRCRNVAKSFGATSTDGTYYKW
mgnify:CR=1 FL=1